MANSPFGELCVNNVDPVTFIAGSQQYFYFDLFNEDGTEFDVSGFGQALLTIAPYNDPYLSLVSIQGEPEAEYTNRIRFSLDGAKTTNLNGVYIHHLILTDGAGNIHKPIQGLITIIPKIGTI